MFMYIVKCLPRSGCVDVCVNGSVKVVSERHACVNGPMASESEGVTCLSRLHVYILG